MPLKAAVQMLGGEVFGPQLLSGSASAALGVHAVPTALLVTLEMTQTTGLNQLTGIGLLSLWFVVKALDHVISFGCFGQ